MIGSTFISTNRPEHLFELKHDIDNLDQIENITLDHLITLDFETAFHDSGVEWIEGDPIIFDEDAGIAIFKINPEALRQIQHPQPILEESSSEDLTSIRLFLTKNGVDHIYELTTF